MALCPGSYAELVVFDHRLAVPIPERLSWEEAATIPVSYNTEHNALVTNARLKPGESVLINAASSGVGVAGVQIARLFGRSRSWEPGVLLRSSRLSRSWGWM